MKTNSMKGLKRMLTGNECHHRGFNSKGTFQTPTATVLLTATERMPKQSRMCDLVDVNVRGRTGTQILNILNTNEATECSSDFL